MVALARIEQRDRPSPDRLGTDHGVQVPFEVWFACTACEGRVGRKDAFCRNCGVQFQQGEAST